MKWRLVSVRQANIDNLGLHRDEIQYQRVSTDARVVPTVVG